MLGHRTYRALCRIINVNEPLDAFDYSEKGDSTEVAIKLLTRVRIPAVLLSLWTVEIEPI